MNEKQNLSDVAQQFENLIDQGKISLSGQKVDRDVWESLIKFRQQEAVDAARAGDMDKLESTLESLEKLRREKQELELKLFQSSLELEREKSNVQTEKSNARTELLIQRLESVHQKYEKKPEEAKPVQGKWKETAMDQGIILATKAIGSLLGIDKGKERDNPCDCHYDDDDDY